MKQLSKEEKFILEKAIELKEGMICRYSLTYKDIILKHAKANNIFIPSVLLKE